MIKLMSSLILDNGYPSLGYIEFKLVKFTHIYHLSLDLCSIITFDIPLRYELSLRNSL